MKDVAAKGDATNDYFFTLDQVSLDSFYPITNKIIIWHLHSQDIRL